MFIIGPVLRAYSPYIVDLYIPYLLWDDIYYTMYMEDISQTKYEVDLWFMR